MNTAQSIVSMPDRTLKERRDMAEIRDIGPKLHGKVDWKGNCEVCYFSDGSKLMMTLDSDFCPTEFLAIAPPTHEEAIVHAIQMIADCRANNIEFDADTISHNIESNFPELDSDECDSIVAEVLNL